jgi:hypothetical protein
MAGKRVLAHPALMPRYANGVIYGLVLACAPRHIYYVGITLRPPILRWAEHVKDGNTPDGSVPIMVLLEECVEAMRIEKREAIWIRRLKRIGMAGRNGPAMDPDTLLRRRVERARARWMDDRLPDLPRVGYQEWARQHTELGHEARRLFPLPAHLEVVP